MVALRTGKLPDDVSTPVLTSVDTHDVSRFFCSSIDFYPRVTTSSVVCVHVSTYLHTDDQSDLLQTFLYVQVPPKEIPSTVSSRPVSENEVTTYKVLIM